MSVSNQPTAEFLNSVRELIQERQLAEAERCLRDRIFGDPLDATAFALLGEVRVLSGQKDAAGVAERRFQQLQQISANLKPAHAAEQYIAVYANAENPADTLELNGEHFAGLRLHQSEGQICLVGCSLDGRAFLKIELNKGSGNLKGLDDEAEVLRALSDQGCVSSARLISAGKVDYSQISSLALGSKDFRDRGFPLDGEEYPYVILEYVRSDRGGFGLAEITLSLLEQQALGIYQNCLSLPHIRFDSIEGVCRFSNYRSAVFLEESVRCLPPRDYLKWCFEREEERSSAGGSFSFLRGRFNELEPLFSGERFLLVRSHIFGRQRTADSPAPWIQDVTNDRVCLQGNVRVADRMELLDELSFSPGERILDLGCGAGALSRYLAQRGCSVVGVDCDEQMIRQSRILSKLEGCSTNFSAMDLDYDFPEGSFETVVALAVLSHIQKRTELTRNIVNAGVRRVVVECALVEPGFKWQGSAFHDVEPHWRFEDLEELKAYLKKLFSTFSSICELGVTDSGRVFFVLEKEENLI